MNSKNLTDFAWCDYKLIIYGLEHTIMMCC